MVFAEVYHVPGNPSYSTWQIYLYDVATEEVRKIYSIMKADIWNIRLEQNVLKFMLSPEYYRIQGWEEKISLSGIGTCQE